MTELTTIGIIDGHKVTVEIEGEEAQDLPDDSDRIGADVLMSRVEEELTTLKWDVQNE